MKTENFDIDDRKVTRTSKEHNVQTVNKTFLTLRAINFVCLIVGVLIVLQLIRLVVAFPIRDKSIVERLSGEGSKLTIKAERGDILARDGRLLATSIPEYDLHMDCKVLKSSYMDKDFKGKNLKKGAPVSESQWREMIRESSEGLSHILPYKSANEWYAYITGWRDASRGGRDVEIARNISLETYLKIEELKPFCFGQYVGGLITINTNTRTYPYGDLGKHAIGYRKLVDGKPTGSLVGLEGSFDSYLSGRDGYIYMKKMDDGIKVRNTMKPERKARNGKDLRTTLDVDIQDISDRSLRDFFIEHPAIREGCAIVIDSKTGAIRGYVNLHRGDNGSIAETYNYAQSNIHEPGSVFKVATTMMALEDGYLKSVNDTIPCFDGMTPYIHPKGGWVIKMSQDPHTTIKDCPEQKMTVKRGIQESSNHIFRYIAAKYYSHNPEKFIAHLEDFHLLDDNSDFDIKGSAKPLCPSMEMIDDPYNATLPMMGMGYGPMITCLNLAGFYNAIANDGKYMKLYLVEGIEQDGKTIKKFGPESKGRICSGATARELTEGLMEVCKPKTCKKGGYDGTGYWAFLGSEYTMAGKTGTCFVAKNGKYSSTERNSVFVGFFPAENPQYTILVGIHTFDRMNSIQGSTCGRVVRKIADWLYFSGTLYGKGDDLKIEMR